MNYGWLDWFTQKRKCLHGKDLLLHIFLETALFNFPFFLVEKVEKSIQPTFPSFLSDVTHAPTHHFALEDKCACIKIT